MILVVVHLRILSAASQLSIEKKKKKTRPFFRTSKIRSKKKKLNKLCWQDWWSMISGMQATQRQQKPLTWAFLHLSLHPESWLRVASQFSVQQRRPFSSCKKNMMDHVLKLQATKTGRASKIIMGRWVVNSSHMPSGNHPLLNVSLKALVMFTLYQLEILMTHIRSGRINTWHLKHWAVLTVCKQEMVP